MSIDTQKIDGNPGNIDSEIHGSVEDELNKSIADDLDYTSYWTNLSLVSIENYLNTLRDQLFIENIESLEKFCVLSDRYDELVSQFNDDKAYGLTVDILELTGDIHKFAVEHVGARSFDEDDAEFFDQ